MKSYFFVSFVADITEVKDSFLLFQKPGPTSIGSRWAPRKADASRNGSV